MVVGWLVYWRCSGALGLCLCWWQHGPAVPILSWFSLWSSLHLLLPENQKKGRGLGRCLGPVSGISLKCCSFLFFIRGTFLGIVGSSTGTNLAFLKPVQVYSCIKMWLHGKGCLASPWRPTPQYSYEPPTIFLVFLMFLLILDCCPFMLVTWKLSAATWIRYHLEPCLSHRRVVQGISLALWQWVQGSMKRWDLGHCDDECFQKKYARQSVWGL